MSWDRSPDSCRVEDGGWRVEVAQWWVHDSQRPVPSKRHFKTFLFINQNNYLFFRSFSFKKVQFSDNPAIGRAAVRAGTPAALAWLPGCRELVESKLDSARGISRRAEAQGLRWMDFYSARIRGGSGQSSNLDQSSKTSFKRPSLREVGRKGGRAVME